MLAQIHRHVRTIAVIAALGGVGWPLVLASSPDLLPAIRMGLLLALAALSLAIGAERSRPGRRVAPAVFFGASGVAAFTQVWLVEWFNGRYDDGHMLSHSVLKECSSRAGAYSGTISLAVVLIAGTLLAVEILWAAQRRRAPAGVSSPPPVPGTVPCCQCRSRYAPADMVAFGSDWVCVDCRATYVQRLKEGAPSAGKSESGVRAACPACGVNLNTAMALSDLRPCPTCGILLEEKIERPWLFGVPFLTGLLGVFAVWGFGVHYWISQNLPVHLVIFLSLPLPAGIYYIAMMKTLAQWLTVYRIASVDEARAA